MHLVSSSIIAFLVSLTLLFALRPLAYQLGLVDVPGGRKTHSGEVPVIGGLAIYGGMLTAVLAMAYEGPGRIALVISFTLVTLVGALDDRFNLPPFVRILAHIAAAATLVLSTGYSVSSLGNLLGLGDIELGPATLIFTITAAIALINGFNMLDGLDGLAGGVAFAALLGLALFFHMTQNLEALVLALAFIGSTLGFLLFNAPVRSNRPWLVFMGDAGSTMLGFALAGLSLEAIQPAAVGMPPIVVLWLMPIPILELFATTFRRLRAGTSPMEADRGHFHHVLLDAGFSVRAIFLVYLVVSNTSCLLGLLSWKQGASEAMMFFGFAALSAVWILFIRHSAWLASRLPEPLRRGQLPSLRRRFF